MAIVITKQPVSTVANLGDIAILTCEATGAEQYQWQYRATSATVWSDSHLDGSNMNVLLIEMTEAQYNHLWRCKLTNSSGDVAFTNAAMIHEAASAMGLISMDTVQGFANETRRLARSKETGTPAELLTMLRGVRADSVRVTTVLTQATNVSTFQLGMAIPDGDYRIIVVPRGSITTNYPNALIAGYTQEVGGVTETWALYTGVTNDGQSTHGSPTAWTVNRETGEITMTSPQIFYPNREYMIVFASGEAFAGSESENDDAETLAAMIAEDMLPTVHDSTGRVLTDVNNTVIMRY